MVIERQPWSKYKEVNKKGSALADNYKKLELRPSEDFNRILVQEVGFSERRDVNKEDNGKRISLDSS